MKRLERVALIGWVTLCAICEAPKAYAGNDDEVLLGNNAALTSGAVTAMVRDGSAIWYNPAGLAGVLVDTLDASGSAFVLRHHRVPNILSDSSGESAGGNITEFVSIPSVLMNLGVQSQVSPRLRLGLSVNSPSHAVYSSFSAPTAVAGVIAIGDQPPFAFVPRPAMRSALNRAEARRKGAVGHGPLLHTRPSIRLRTGAAWRS